MTGSRSRLGWWLPRILSPTYAVANGLKRRCAAGPRSFIIGWHRCFQLFSASSLLLLFLAGPWVQGVSLPAVVVRIVVILICWFRCNEIVFAFIADAIEHLQPGAIEPQFQPLERLQMLIGSYFEVMVNFAIVYTLLPQTWFNESKLKSVLDALYFSGITLTTVGYGDIFPVHVVARFLTVHEALVGVALLVLVIAVYLGSFRDVRL